MAVMTILARHAEDGAQDVVGYHRHQHYLAVQSRWKSFYRAHSRDAWGQHYNEGRFYLPNIGQVNNIG